MSSEGHYCDYSFGGSDEGSHYMSVSVEKIREEFREKLYRKPELSPHEEAARKKRTYNAQQEPTTMYGILSENIRKEMDEEILKELLDPHGWIQLYSGRKFFPMAPVVEDIDIEDIAHSLSNMCRFTGHCREFYSVAQHSVLVSYLVGGHALYGLLHDASEAYMVDMPRPIKRLREMQPFRDMEHKVMMAVCKRFGLPPNEPPVVKQADTQMLATEARDLMSPLHPDWNQPCEPLPFRIDPLPPKEAKKLFLDRYRELVEKNDYK